MGEVRGLNPKLYGFNPVQSPSKMFDTDFMIGSKSSVFTVCSYFWCISPKYVETLLLSTKEILTKVEADTATRLPFIAHLLLKHVA